MGLEKHPVLVSVLVSKKLSGLGLGLGLEACGLDYNTGKKLTNPAQASLKFHNRRIICGSLALSCGTN